MTHDASSCVVAVKKAIRQLTLAQGSPLMREFSASWHLVLVFQNKRDCQSVAKLIYTLQRDKANLKRTTFSEGAVM